MTVPWTKDALEGYFRFDSYLDSDFVPFAIANEANKLKPEQVDRLATLVKLLTEDPVEHISGWVETENSKYYFHWVAFEFLFVS